MFMDPSLAAKAGKASMGAEHLAAKKVAVVGHEVTGGEKLAAKKLGTEVRPAVKAVSHNG